MHTCDDRVPQHVLVQGSILQQIPLLFDQRLTIYVENSGIGRLLLMTISIIHLGTVVSKNVMKDVT
jgi:hypothetical protein